MHTRLLWFGLTSALLPGCNPDSDTDTPGGDTNVPSVFQGFVQVADSFAQGGARRAFGDGLDVDGAMVSYTPDSWSMGIDTLGLSTADGQSIAIGGTGEPTEFVGLNPFASVFSGEVEIDEDDAGTYTTIDLFITDGAANASVSLSVNGKTYEYSNTTLPLQGASFSTKMPNPLVIEVDASDTDDTDSGEGGLVFVAGVVVDLRDVMLLVRYDDEPVGATLVDAETHAYTIANTPIIMPYVGADTPTIEVYEVSFDTDQFGDSSLYSLRLDVIRDSQGQVTCAGWTTSYLEGYSWNSGFEPRMLVSPELTEVAADVWHIADGKEGDPATAARALDFPAFTLADHSGTMTYGDMSIDYTAVKED